MYRLAHLSEFSDGSQRASLISYALDHKQCGAGDDAARIERRCHTKGERERKVNLKHRYRLPGSIPSGLSRPIPHRPIKSPAVVVATTKRVVLASAAVAVITRITVRVESTTV